MRLGRRLVVLAMAAGCAAAAGDATAAFAHAAPIGAYTAKGAWSFVSSPDLHPPKLGTTIRTKTSKLAAGDFLLANFPNVGAPGPMTGQSGPLIVDNTLKPVWFASVGTGQVAADLQQQVYDGQPVLVYWQGVVSRTGVTTAGQVVVVDQHYRPLATLEAERPWVISLHDAVIQGSDIWVTVYRYVSGQNLKPYHGSSSGTVLDAGVQEYSLKTGGLLYTWDALNPGHQANIPLSESRQPVPKGNAAWDAYHVDTVEPLATGQVLISMRNTWTVYLVDPKESRVVWTLGGRHSAFTGKADTRFAWQHDAELRSDVAVPADEDVTMFNDNCCGIKRSGEFEDPNGISDGLVLRLDPTAHTVTLVRSYSARARITAFLGSMQLLPNGNALVGYGSLPFFTEFDPSGHRLLDVQWPGKDQSYRAEFTSSWVGTPSSPPAGAARRQDSTTAVYASWNGATQVASWELLGGSSTANLKPITTKPRSGFETTFSVKGTTTKTFEVVALDARGHALGVSEPFTVG